MFLRHYNILDIYKFFVRFFLYPNRFPWRNFFPDYFQRILHFLNPAMSRSRYYLVLLNHHGLVESFCLHFRALPISLTALAALAWAYIRRLNTLLGYYYLGIPCDLFLSALWMLSRLLRVFMYGAQFFRLAMWVQVRVLSCRNKSFRRDAVVFRWLMLLSMEKSIRWKPGGKRLIVMRTFMHRFWCLSPRSRKIWVLCLVKRVKVQLQLGSRRKEGLERMQGRQVRLSFIHSKGIITSTRRVATSTAID